MAAALSHLVETEVAPRLMMAHAVPAARAVAVPDDQDSRVSEFARLALRGDMAQLRGYVDALRGGGTSLETVFDALMTPAARLLGEWWIADACDFLEVTLGVAHLQRLMTSLAVDGFRDYGGIALDRRIFLMPAPGEQHHFGLTMLAKFFERAGWDVAGGVPGADQGYEQVLRRESVSVVGLSLSAERGLPALASAIRTIRKLSRNKSVRVMVGGAAFLERPERAVLVGADATAANASVAVLVAQNLLEMSVRPC